MTPERVAEGVALYVGDCLDVLASLPDASVDAVVTDPPYGLADHPVKRIEQALTAWLTGDRSHVPDGRGFMGREWDKFVPPPAAWDECYRVLKPGGHLLAFAAPRTYDLMGISIRLAGFEVFDSIDWINGQGFPKSLNVSKAIDKAAGAQREVSGFGPDHAKRTAAAGRGGTITRSGGDAPIGQVLTAPATPDAARWNGWGTALKPSHEPIVLAMKPLDGTYAANVLEHGTGAMNIAGCSVGTTRDVPASHSGAASTIGATGISGKRLESELDPNQGRWPSNILLSEEAAEEMDRQSGALTSALRGKGYSTPATNEIYGKRDQSPANPGNTYGDTGGASRFFPVFRYQAKAPARERPRLPDGTAWPTVKPLELMRWLVRLVTPPHGTVLDLFAGTGTTGEACLLEGFPCVLIEKDPVAAELIRIRLGKPAQPDLFAAGA